MTVRDTYIREKIEKLIAIYNNLSEKERYGLSESGVIHQFIDPFLEALGWPIDDPSRYIYETTTVAGRPDMILNPEKGGKIFVEAKRFGLIQELAQARRTLATTLSPGQLSLPGMATDRTREEQQVINYAFRNGGTYAILTSFEKLRLFNARRDWLVLSFENPSAYLEDFDLLKQLTYENVCEGSLDLLSNERVREDIDSDYLNFINEWREKLAKDILANSEENQWALTSGKQVNVVMLREVVQRILDRLVVVRFAEDHLLIPVGTLFGIYELRKSNPYTHTLAEMMKQLYRRFDEEHNSALFAPHTADNVKLSDEILEGLIEKLYEARYRAMSADIMGNTYEQYLGKTLVLENRTVVSADNLENRKRQGSYYTPQAIVQYIVDNTLGQLLYGTTDGKANGEIIPGERRKTSDMVKNLRVLDPACGSGSFLIYAYEVLADFYKSEIQRLVKERELKREELIRGGMTVPFDLQLELTPWSIEIERLNDFPTLILQKHIYGVDLDPQAAEIATVNLMMRAMVDQKTSNKRLPIILNQNIKVGNSLVGAPLNDPQYIQLTADLAELWQQRDNLIKSGGRKEHTDILNSLNEINNRLNPIINKNLESSLNQTELYKPFNWVNEFPEAFVDDKGKPKDEQAGFDVIIGNPPYSYRNATEDGIRDYYSQFYEVTEGNYELYKLFLERAVKLSRKGGLVGFVVSATFLIQPSFEKLRDYLTKYISIKMISPLGPKAFKAATVDTVIVIGQNETPKIEQRILVTDPRALSKLKNSKGYFVEQSRFRNNEGHVFDYRLSDEGALFVKRLFSEYRRLDDWFEVGVGVNTGFIRDELVSNNRIDERYHPMVAGTGISRYGDVKSKQWIMYDRDYVIAKKKLGRSLPPEKFFENEKVLVVRTRNLSLNCRIIATLDRSRAYNLNRLSNIIRRNDHSLEGLLGILNSTLFNWLFSTRFYDYEIKPVYLKNSPIPNCDDDDLKKTVNKMLSLRSENPKTDSEKLTLDREIDSLEKRIDNIVFDLYKVRDSELNLIHSLDVKE